MPVKEQILIKETQPSLLEISRSRFKGTTYLQGFSMINADSE